jgi:hypothetical protein
MHLQLLKPLTICHESVKLQYVLLNRAAGKEQVVAHTNVGHPTALAASFLSLPNLRRALQSDVLYYMSSRQV